MVISKIFVFESRCLDCRYWTSWRIFMLRVPKEGAKSIDRTESSDSLLAEAIRLNDDLRVLKEDIELVSERESWYSSKVVIGSPFSSPGMSSEVPDA